VLTDFQRAFVFLVVALALSACGRERVVLAPEFTGTFVAHGKPGVGAEVLIGFSGDHDRPCNDLPVAAVVDAGGHFHVPAKTVQMSTKERAAIPYGTFQNYVCFRYNDELLISSMFITSIDETDTYVGACVTPHTPTFYDDHMCSWRREHA
jgi:hypothetical protein